MAYADGRHRRDLTTPTDHRGEPVRDASSETWNGTWADAAYSLLDASLVIDLDHCGRDLPDVNLDDLCEAIFANLRH